jgi:hypothetical protein
MYYIGARESRKKGAFAMKIIFDFIVAALAFLMMPTPAKVVYFDTPSWPKGSY